jgi:uncharacterized membrane protein YciS (DUF1049 family)
MRFLLIVVILALVLAIVGFGATNIETLTTVTLWQTTYHDVPLWSVVFLSALAGVVSVGIIGMVDGALVRFRNRQMSRELRRLETELNFLRTQPLAARREPDVPGEEEIPDDDGERVAVVDPAQGGGDPASAPVYHSDGADEDDPYTGGRAV